MNFVQLWTLHTIFAGIGGVLAHGNIARWRTSTESFDSESLPRRWLYRYFLFSLAYFFSFFVSPMVLMPASNLIGPLDLSLQARQLLYPFCLLPIAILFFIGDLRLMRSWDARKIEAREALRWRGGR